MTDASSANQVRGAKCGRGFNVRVHRGVPAAAAISPPADGPVLIHRPHPPSPSSRARLQRFWFTRAASSPHGSPVRWCEVGGASTPPVRGTFSYRHLLQLSQFDVLSSALSEDVFFSLIRNKFRSVLRPKIDRSGALTSSGSRTPPLGVSGGEGVGILGFSAGSKVTTCVYPPTIVS